MRTILLVSLALGFATLAFSQVTDSNDTNFENFFEIFEKDSLEAQRMILILPGKNGIYTWHRDFAKLVGRSNDVVFLFDPVSTLPQSRAASKDWAYANEVEILKKVVDEAKRQEPSTEIILIGFEEGVEQCFELMTRFTNIREAYVVGGYPRSVRASQFSKIQCKIYGFFPDQDKEGTRYLSFMKRYLYGNGKNFQVSILKNASQSFLEESGEDGTSPTDQLAKKEVLSSVRKYIQGP
ncbi:MAG: dienelactone hydrolase family protein [Bacteroidia bacterium]|nr:dienelactone hydrolase family protein [Bacteroidia bacterium]